MKNILFVFLISAISLLACKSSVKEQKDKIYSRHLQRHIDLTVITTPLPEKKEQMNLLLCTHGDQDVTINFPEAIRAKRIIDSLYKHKLIQPVTLVTFGGKPGDYGLEEADIPEAKQYKKFNSFVINELYPFAKKKVGVRKFNSVAICGFAETALSSFDIAWNNDDKIQKAGMFLPLFFLGGATKDSATLQTIKSLRKKPHLKIWLTDNSYDSASFKFKNIVSAKEHISECTFVKAQMTEDGKLVKTEFPYKNFADFLLWAFPR